MPRVILTRALAAHVDGPLQLEIDAATATATATATDALRACLDRYPRLRRYLLDTRPACASTSTSS